MATEFVPDEVRNSKLNALLLLPENKVGTISNAVTQSHTLSHVRFALIASKRTQNGVHRTLEYSYATSVLRNTEQWVCIFPS